MAYVEWHGEIRKHDKTDDLMRRLKISRREAVGIIGCISAYAIAHQPGGILERSKIVTAVEWDGDPDQLLKALLASHWLDEFDKGMVEIHDWAEITTGYQKAKRDAARKRKDRRDRKVASQRPKTVRGQGADKPVHGASADGRETSSVRRAEQTDRPNRPTEQQQPHGVSKPRTAPRKPPSSKPQGPSGGEDQAGEGVAVVAPDRKEGGDEAPHTPGPSRTPLLEQVNFKRSLELLAQVELSEPIAVSLAKAHPVGRVFDAVEQSLGADNRAGYVRDGLDQGWKFRQANGPALAQLTRLLEADDLVAGGNLERKANSLGITRSARERQPGESEDDWLRRVQSAPKS